MATFTSAYTGPQIDARLALAQMSVQAATTSGVVTEWASLVTVSSSAATTQTLPDAVVGEVSKSVTFKNLGAGIVTVALFAGNTTSGAIPTMSIGDSLTVRVFATGIVLVTDFNLGAAVSPDLLSPWVALTPVLAYQERSLSVGGTTVAMMSASARTTLATFSITEAGFWSYQAQVSVEPFPVSTVVLDGFQIIDGGQTYQANATRITGTTFDATEQLQWTALSVSASGTRINLANYTTNAVIGTALATVDSATVLAFTQTTANIAVTLPTPTTVATHKTMTLENVPASTAAIKVSLTSGTVTLAVGQSQRIQWNGTSWSAFTAGAPVVPSWTASIVVPLNALASLTIGATSVTLKNGLLRTTGLTFDATEASGWTLLDQSTIQAFPLNTVIPIGFKVAMTGQIFQSNGNRLTTGNWDATEIGNWTALTAGATVSPWVALTSYPANALVQVTLAGVTYELISGTSRTSGAAFNIAEAGFWSQLSQDTIAAFPVSGIVFAGAKIVNNKQLWQSPTTRTSGTAFDAAEKLLWTQLTAASDTLIALPNFATSGVIGTALLTVDVASVFAFTQTTAGVFLTIPSPTTSATPLTVKLESLPASTAPLTFTFATGSVVLPIGQNAQIQWNGSTWEPVQQSFAKIGVWTPGVRCSTGALAYITRGTNALVTMVNIGVHTNNATFDLAESLNWYALSQSFYEAFTASTVVMTGFTIVEAGVMYKALSSRTTGLTFDVAEKAFWAASILGATSTVFVADTAVSGSVGTALATVDVATTIAFTQTTANIAITLPIPTLPLVHKQITLENLPASTATLTFALGSTLTLVPGVSQIVQWNGTSWLAMGIANLVAEWVAPQYPVTATVTPSSSSAVNSTDYLSITLPSKGTWEIQWTVRGSNNGVANSGIASCLTDSANAVQVGSETLSNYIASGSTQGCGSGSYVVTTTGAATYKVRVYAISTTSSQALSDLNGRSFVMATKIGGNLPVTGTTVDFMSMSVGTLAPGAGVAMTLNSGSGNMSLASSTVILTAGKIYRLDAGVTRINGVSGSSEFTYCWRDTTNNVYLGVGGSVSQNTALGAGGLASAVVSPTANISVQLWCIKNVSVSSLSVNDNISAATGAGFANIVQIGSSALSGIAAPSLSRVALNQTVTSVIGGTTTLYVDATAGARTITLPLASTSTNMVVRIKKIDSSANAVSVVRSSTDTIDGATSFSLAAQYDSNDFCADSTNNYWGVH